MMEIYSLLALAVIALITCYILWRLAQAIFGIEDRYEYVEDAEGNVIKVIDRQDSDNDSN